MVREAARAVRTDACEPVVCKEALVIVGLAPPRVVCPKGTQQRRGYVGPVGHHQHGQPRVEGVERGVTHDRDRAGEQRLRSVGRAVPMPCRCGAYAVHMQCRCNAHAVRMRRGRASHVRCASTPLPRGESTKRWRPVASRNCEAVSFCCDSGVSCTCRGVLSATSPSLYSRYFLTTHLALLCSTRYFLTTHLALTAPRLEDLPHAPPLRVRVAHLHHEPRLLGLLQRAAQREQVGGEIGMEDQGRGLPGLARRLEVVGEADRDRLELGVAHLVVHRPPPPQLLRAEHLVGPLAGSDGVVGGVCEEQVRHADVLVYLLHEGGGGPQRRVDQVARFHLRGARRARSVARGPIEEVVSEVAHRVECVQRVGVAAAPPRLLAPISEAQRLVREALERRRAASHPLGRQLQLVLDQCHEARRGLARGRCLALAPARGRDTVKRQQVEKMEPERHGSAVECTRHRGRLPSCHAPPSSPPHTTRPRGTKVCVGEDRQRT
eukprot:scaffold23527_cov61-Phaeocystis_antarctica.AAC.4